MRQRFVRHDGNIKLWLEGKTYLVIIALYKNNNMNLHLSFFHLSTFFFPPI